MIHWELADPQSGHGPERWSPVRGPACRVLPVRVCLGLSQPCLVCKVEIIPSVQLKLLRGSTENNRGK